MAIMAIPDFSSVESITEVILAATTASATAVLATAEGTGINLHKSICEQTGMNMKPRTSKKEDHSSANPAQQVATEQIQERAYQLYVSRGQEPGHELEDWLEAEREIKGGHERQYAG